jgi:hypothetical protein
VSTLIARYRLLQSTSQLDLFGIPTAAASEHWTAQDRARLADAMIAKWQAFKMAGVQPVDLGAALATNIAR